MDKTSIRTYLEENKQRFFDLSDQIWSFAELSMKEFRSAALYESLLAQEGFAVQTGLAGVETAFCGSFGSGRPRIGILGEFDALSALSQSAGCIEKTTETPGACGHGCGHNLLGAASFAAACAVKRFLQEQQCSGTVIFYGCPGEEGCAGKAFMAREGLFRDLDAALCWHPGDTNEVTSGSNAASLQVAYTFRGLASHAAESPDMGRSALDAAELMNVGVQFLREHMKRSDSIHYSILDAGGASPNVVQPTARLLYMVRSDNVRHAKALLKRVDKIAEGAALMTETTVSHAQVDGTSSTLSNRVLEQLLDRNLREAPLPQYTEEEWFFADRLFHTYETEGLPGSVKDEEAFIEEKSEGGRRSLNDFILPYRHSDVFHPGSTDVGDVSWLTPTAQFTAVTWTSGSPGHSWQNVSIGKSSIAHKGLLLAANVLAGAAADLIGSQALLQQAQAEFRKTAKDGYDCPLGPEVLPVPAV